MATKIPYFEAYAVGACHASACTNMSDEEAIAEMNALHPTGIANLWEISSAKTFRTGEPNPKVCEDNPNRRHILFVC